MKEKYVPSSEELKKAEEMMTENERTRSKEEEETIKVAVGKIENRDDTKKLEVFKKIIEKNFQALFDPEEAHILIIESKGDLGGNNYITSGVGSKIEGDNFVLENLKTHRMEYIPIDEILKIKKEYTRPLHGMLRPNETLYEKEK